MRKPQNTNAEFAAECESINTERERLFAELHAANKAGLTGAALDAHLDGMDNLDDRAEALKKKHYPRRAGKLSIALGGAIIISPTGRTSELLWSAKPKVEHDEYDVPADPMDAIDTDCCQ